MMWTDDQIQQLITCTKTITRAPGKLKLQSGHFRTDFELTSEAGDHVFRVFIRYNAMFMENFSVGLDYKSGKEEGTICLYRCNGPHGDTRPGGHHGKPHIHYATAETIDSDRRSESNITQTAEFVTWQDALAYFVRHVRIFGAEEYFDFLNSQQLEFGLDGLDDE